MDHLQPLAASPSSLSHSANPCFYLDMPDFRMEGEGLWQDPISSAGWNSNGLAASLELPFVHRVPKGATGT